MTGCSPQQKRNDFVQQDSNEGAGGWLRLTVQKVAGVASISLVQIQGQGITWQSMENKWGASWEIAAAPPPPLDLRIVQTDGSEVSKNTNKSH